MTVTSQICKRIYQADGTNRVWELDFPVLSAQEVQLYVKPSGGTETRITSNYEVNLANGTVTYPTVGSGANPLETGTAVVLVRNTALTQPIHLTQQGTLDAAELESGYDKLTLQMQELAERTERCIKYPVSSGQTGTDAHTFLAEFQSRQTDALNTALEQVESLAEELTQDLQTETTARTEADSALQTALNAEVSNRQAGDLALSQQVQLLSGMLATETATRADETAALQTAVSNETMARQSALTSEAGAREAADALLLLKTEAASTYLTQANAAATYLKQAAASATYIPSTQKAAANGVASLDSNGQVPGAQIPYATASSVGGVKMEFDDTTDTLVFIVE